MLIYSEGLPKITEATSTIQLLLLTNQNEVNLSAEKAQNY